MHTTTHSMKRLAMLGAMLSAATPAAAQITLKPIIAHNEQGRKEQPGQHKRTPSATESALDATVRLLGNEDATTSMADPRLREAWGGGWTRGSVEMSTFGDRRVTPVGGASGASVIPAPGAGVLLTLGAVLAWRRRRRSVAAPAGEDR